VEDREEGRNVMIQVALDWNCIIELEEERPSAPFLRQFQHWAMQGHIALCLSAPSRLENPQGSTKAVIEEEWTSKLRRTELEGIEIRWPRTRAFVGADGSSIFDGQIEDLVRRKIHDILFPGIDYSYTNTVATAWFHQFPCRDFST
jgi:hypothetical protein